MTPNPEGLFVGVDVGAKGAVVALNEDGTIAYAVKLQPLDFEKPPTFRKAAEVYYPILSKAKVLVFEKQWFGQFEKQTKTGPYVVSMPKKAISNYARQVGFMNGVWGVCGAGGAVMCEIRPKEWQNEFVGKGGEVKLGSIIGAKRRWSERASLFDGGMGSHFADACWLAEWGRLKGLHSVQVSRPIRRKRASAKATAEA